MCGAALLLLMYFTAVRDRVAVRIVIVAFVLLVSRGLIALELLRQAGQRSILNVFAALMAVYGVFGAVRTIATFLNGPPYDFMQTSRFQTPSLVVSHIRPSKHRHCGLARPSKGEPDALRNRKRESRNLKPTHRVFYPFRNSQSVFAGNLRKHQ
jgi:hypothetical protein